MLTQAMITRKVHSKHIPLIERGFDFFGPADSLETVLQNLGSATMCHSAIDKRE
jgi:hypothetical protein